MSHSDRSLRLAIYDALEESSHLTVPELAQLVDSGAPATQAEIRAVLRAEPQVFWPEEERWDLAIFHRFAAQPHLFHGRGSQAFDPQRFLKTVLAEAIALKGQPIHLTTLAEKYLLKIAKSLGISKQQFPTDRRNILRRLNEFIERDASFHRLRQNGDAYLWNAPDWPQQVQVASISYFLPGDFLDRAFDFLETRRQPTRLLEILQAVLGIDTNHADFSVAFAQANAALDADNQSFVRVQDQAWMLAHHLPAAIEEIPARIAIPRWRNADEEKLVDALYADWPVEALAEAVAFVDEEAQPAADAGFDEHFLGPLRFVLPYRWRQAGVLKVNARERRLFPDQPARVALQFHDQYGTRFPVWLNNDTGYLYGLQDWYAAYLVPAGGVFYLERSPGSKYDFKVRIQEGEAHTFEGRQFVCEVDPDTYIEEARLRDLEALRAKVEAAQATIKDVVCDVFESSGPEAELHYKQVWAQVHVVRPTTRRTVASILSAFPCFYQVEKGSGLWRYTPGLRHAPAKTYQTKRPAKPKPTVTPTPRLAHYWLAPVQANSWEALARRAAGDAEIFLTTWRGRARIARGDQVAFLDAKSGLLLAAVEALREPVQNDASGQREVAVRPLLPAFRAAPYDELAGSLSVPRPAADDLPVSITAEDMAALLRHLRPPAAPKPAEPPIEELIRQALPQPEPVPGEIIAHTYGPNPTIAAFIARYGRPYDPAEPYERSAFAFPVKAARSGTIYDAHPYHTKVPPQGIEPYIEHYTNPGDIVLDPFCGTGMTGVAALKLGRRVILNDLSPAATHIAYNYCAPVDVDALQREFGRIRAAVKEEFDWLYGTTCERCGGAATIQYTIWSDVYECANCLAPIRLWDAAVDADNGRILEIFPCPNCGWTWQRSQLSLLRSEPVITNYKCPTCKPSQSSRVTSASEKALINAINAVAIPYWYPNDPIAPYREMMTMGPTKRGIRRVSDFYTHRNLWAIARLWEESLRASDERLVRALQFVVTAIALSHTTIMTRMILKGGRNPVLTSHMTGTLYVPALPVEKNVWEVYGRKFRDAIQSFEAISTNRLQDVVIATGSATDLSNIPDRSVDYIFTDPPFGGNIYYSDCSVLWEAWLQQYTDESFEIHYNRIRKPEQGGKTMEDYKELMAQAFREMHRVLKPGRWVSVVFHNSEDRVWRVIQQGAEEAGFDLVNAMVFDKEQRSFKGVLGEKGIEKVTNFDVVLNLHKRAETQPVATLSDQARVEQVVLAAVEAHLRSGPAPDYRTGQYLHSLAIRALLNEKISVELTWPQLDRLLERHFRHINCHWYLPKEAVAPSGHGFLVRSDAAAVAWLEHLLAASPQSEGDLIPQWQIATLGAGSRIKSTLAELLRDHFWQDESSGLWCLPTAAQREILKRRRAKPQQLALGLEGERPGQFEFDKG